MKHEINGNWERGIAFEVNNILNGREFPLGLLCGLILASSEFAFFFNVAQCSTPNYLHYGCFAAIDESRRIRKKL